MPKIHIATGLPKDQRVGVATTPEMVKKIWSTIDAWGKNTTVRLVFTMGGRHVMDFPSMGMEVIAAINSGKLAFGGTGTLLGTLLIQGGRDRHPPHLVGPFGGTGTLSL